MSTFIKVLEIHTNSHLVLNSNRITYMQPTMQDDKEIGTFICLDGVIELHCYNSIDQILNQIRTE